MTANQINFYNAVENRRHNIATENETHRTNRYYEQETTRHNVATETETNRHNVVTENETARHNKVSEQIGWHQAYSQRISANAAMINAQAAKKNADTNRAKALSDIAAQSYVNSLNSSKRKYTDAQTEYQKTQNEIASKTKEHSIGAANATNKDIEWLHRPDSNGNNYYRTQQMLGVVGAALSGVSGTVQIASAVNKMM